MLEPEACVLVSTPFRAAEPIDLRIAATSMVFARVASANAAILHLPLGEGSRGAVIDLDAGGVHLRAHTTPHLHHRRASSLFGVLWPRGRAVLSVQGAVLERGEPRVAVTYGLPPAVEWLSTPSESAHCDDLALSPQERPPNPAGLGPATDEADLRESAKVTLYAHPRDLPVLVVDTAVMVDRRVEVHQRTSDWVQISWPSHDLLFSGWVQTDDLVPRGDRGAAPAPKPDSGLSGRGAFFEVVQCEGEIPLILEHRGQRRTVGVILPGTSAGIGESVDGLQEVEIWNTPVELVRGARWLAPGAQLGDCQRVQ